MVKPGMPFQVVANFQSKRKTPALVAFAGGERLFGADAEALLGRKPSLVLASPLTLLGRNASHPLVQSALFASHQAVDVRSGARGGLEAFFPVAPAVAAAAGFANETALHFSAEELAAMLLAHARDFASHVADQRIQDAVITVPAFAAQGERLALIAAAELAGLKVLALIDENTAVGVHYGIDRVFENTTHYMMLYNMGAESTQVRARERERGGREDGTAMATELRLDSVQRTPPPSASSFLSSHAAGHHLRL